MRRRAMGCLSASLIVVGFAVSAHGTALINDWSTSYRGDIKVYFCVDTFTTWLPGLDLDKVRANVKLAIDTWNTYGGVDFYLDWYGDRAGTRNGCSPNQMPSSGEVTVKAEDYRGGSVLAAVDMGSAVPMVRSTLSMYKRNDNGTISWTFDHTTNDFDIATVLTHEFGHVIGFGDIYSPAYATVMNGTLGAYNRVVWHEDVTKLRDTSQTHHYNHVTTRQIVHKRSTDNGLNWSSQGNLQEHTNSKLGVGFNATAQRYMVAWRGTDGSTYLNTILGNGSSYDSSSKKTWAVPLDYGPAVAFGNGMWVVADVTTSDSRNLEYCYSTDGTTLYGTTTILYGWNATGGSTSYGSMWEPAIAWNANKSHFILAWTNWRNQGDDNPLGYIRACTNPDPSSQNFYRCVETTIVSNSSPGLACHASNNDCLLTWVDDTGYLDHQICYSKALLGTSNDFQLTGSTYCFSTDSTRLATSDAYGRGYWMLSYRGNDGSTWGNNLRMSTWPTWGNRTNPDSQIKVSPTIQYGSTWSEFAYYYVRR